MCRPIPIRSGGRTLSKVDDAFDVFSGRGFDGEPRYFDRDGKPLTLLEWGTLFEDLEYKIVAQVRIRGWFVSTVWLGLDHGMWNWGTVGAEPYQPMIFETMVFDPWGDEQMQDRYATEAEAKDGHELACAWVREQSTGIKWRCVSLWKWITRTLVRRFRSMRWRLLIARWRRKNAPTTPLASPTLTKTASPSVTVRLRTRDTPDSK